jgi:hypothetical protein
MKLTLISRKETYDTNNLFHAQYALLESTIILSENVPDAMDNKGVTRGDNVKCFIPFVLYLIRTYLAFNEDIKIQDGYIHQERY